MSVLSLNKFIASFVNPINNLIFASTKNYVEIVRVRHDIFHLVAPSIWPLVTASSAYYFLSSMVYYMHYKTFTSGFFDLFTFLVLAVIFWFKDIIVESNFYHTKTVQKGIKIGFLLFVFSEVMVFFGLFWAFFAYSLCPPIEIGAAWPPKDIEIIQPFEIPLVNTVLLLMSGAFVTWSHHALIKGDYTIAIVSLVGTIILAVFFTLLQLHEYNHASFCISDGVYGCTFYMLTGCHGMHVIIGTILLTVGLFRLFFNFSTQTLSLSITSQNHIGYELAIWYWHFVDVVWLFLYIFVYCCVYTL